MKFLAKWKRKIDKKYRIIYKRGPSTVAAVFLGVAVLAWGLFLVITGFPVAAYAYYTVRPATSQILSQALADTALRSSELRSGTAGHAAIDVPVSTDIGRDVSLPEGHYVTIPSIGVDTVIWEAPYSDYETALKKGVWRVPDFAAPGDGSGKPVILAAHRFGYLDWSQDFRVKNSFYNLPNLKAGDKIRVIWDQHQYVYEVQALTEGTEITDYSADLILYTCKFLVSPVRYFVYAKLLN